MDFIKLLCGAADSDSDSTIISRPRHHRPRQRKTTARTSLQRSPSNGNLKLYGRLIRSDSGSYEVEPFPPNSVCVSRREASSIERSVRQVGERRIKWARDEEDRTTKIGDILVFVVPTPRSRRRSLKVSGYGNLTASDPNKYPNQNSRGASRRSPSPSEISTESASNTVLNTETTYSSNYRTSIDSGSTTSSEQTYSYSSRSTEIGVPHTIFKAWKEGRITTLSGKVHNGSSRTGTKGLIRATGLETVASDTRKKLQNSLPFDLSCQDFGGLSQGERVLFELELDERQKAEVLIATNVRAFDERRPSSSDATEMRLVGKIIRLPSGNFAGAIVVYSPESIADHIAQRRHGAQKPFEQNEAAQRKYATKQFGYVNLDSLPKGALEVASTGDLVSFVILQNGFAGKIVHLMASKLPSVPSTSKKTSRSVSLSSDSSSLTADVPSRPEKAASVPVPTKPIAQRPSAARNSRRRSSHRRR